MRDDLLLTIDGVVNLALGLLLLFFFPGVVSALGIPPAESRFYPSILGAVLFGIGVALVLESRGKDRSLPGLGFLGAIAINLCGGGVLAGWLISGSLEIPLRGKVILWVVAIVVLGLSLVEILVKPWARQ